MKIALYNYGASIGQDSSPHVADDWMDEEKSGFIRTSDIVEVSFERKDKSDLILKKVALLRSAKQRKMQEFDEQIAKLQALTYQPEEEGS